MGQSTDALGIYIDTTCYKNMLLIQKFNLQRSTMSLPFKNYSLVEVIYLL